MADEELKQQLKEMTPEDRKAFIEWYKSVHGRDPRGLSKLWDIGQPSLTGFGRPYPEDLEPNLRAWQREMVGTAPTYSSLWGLPLPTKYGSLKMTGDQYKKAIIETLNQLADAGQISDAQVDEWYYQAADAVDAAGGKVHEGLPLYQLVYRGQEPYLYEQAVGQWQENRADYDAYMAQQAEESRLRQFYAPMQQAAGTQRWQAYTTEMANQRKLQEQYQEQALRVRGEQTAAQLSASASQLAASVSDHPRDWIQKHYAQQVINLLRWQAGEAKRAGGDYGYTSGVARGPEDAASQGLEYYITPETLSATFSQQQAARDYNISQTPGGGTSIPEPTRESAIGQAVASELGYASGVGGGGYPAPETGIAPNVPNWLLKYAPALQGVKKLKKVPMAGLTAPSPQSWRATPFKEQQKLAGYFDKFYGEGSFEEYMRQIARNLPRTPSGVSSARWAPEIQRA